MYVANGWNVYFHRLFAERYGHLLTRAAALNSELPVGQYRRHQDVKLLAKVTRVIREIVPANPNG